MFLILRPCTACHDDGSIVNVHIILPGGADAPDEGTFVAVVGISFCEKVGGGIVRLKALSDVERTSPGLSSVIV